MHMLMLTLVEGEMERLVLLVTPEQKRAIATRAKEEKVPMGELVRRSIEHYYPAADAANLDRLLNQVAQSTREANTALDDALKTVGAALTRMNGPRVKAAAAGKVKRRAGNRR